VVAGRRRKLQSSQAAITIAGAIMHLQDLTLEGIEGVATISVSSGELWLHNCTLRNARGVRALEVTGGRV
jgi:hypothetical protein